MDSDDARIETLLARVAEMGASDLHVVAGYPPMARVHAELRSLDEAPLEAEVVRAILTPLLPERLRNDASARQDVDFALQIELNGQLRRIRANYFQSLGSLGACFRLIPAEIPNFDWAGFPQELAERLAGFHDGLALVCGATGAGKTTTLAMVVNLLAQQSGYRIITIEEPIEYRFNASSRSMITQREVGEDVASFADGLRYGLRQDPDVILVGEIRDRDTAQMALSAAETGHLVLATMHTRDAKGAISRFADFFAPEVQTEIRSLLATSLRAVVSQHLLPSSRPGAKRELAIEVLTNSSAVAAAIRSGKVEQIDNAIQTGRADNMSTLSASVRNLFRAGKISREVAEPYIADARAL
jgi:twitching motility protein PilT